MKEKEKPFNEIAARDEANKNSREVIEYLFSRAFKEEEKEKIKSIYSKTSNIVKKFGTTVSTRDKSDFRIHYYRETSKLDLGGGISLKLIAFGLEKDILKFKNTTNFSVDIFRYEGDENPMLPGLADAKIGINKGIVTVWQAEKKEIPRKASLLELAQIEELIDSVEILYRTGPF